MPSSSALDRTSEQVDVRFMAQALAMARRGLGTTAPNPSVGAVIVRPGTGEILARGWTQPGGRPHAETTALASARALGMGDAIAGATLYVTLEPCSHHGRTPPCSEAIIDAQIGRVVYGITDPDPRVAGRGLAMLRAAGVAITQVPDRGLVEEIRFATLGHIVRVTERRPMVTLKLALGADGDVPRGGSGRPTWVTAPESRALGHLLRAEADAILVGSRTVVDDDPALTCRLPGLEQRSPIPVVLARTLDVPMTAKLITRARGSGLRVYHGPEVDDRRRKALMDAGATSVQVAIVGDGLWLPAVLEDLAQAGVTRLLVEGGPAMWRAFSRAGLVDDVAVFMSRSAAEQGGEPGVRPSGSDTVHPVHHATVTHAIAAASRHVDMTALACYACRDVGAHDALVQFRRRRG